MAKVRQLVNHLEIETAQRRRICHHSRSKHSIEQGDRCLVIRNPDGAGSKNYCIDCATAILDRAEQDLAELRARLTGS